MNAILSLTLLLLVMMLLIGGKQGLANFFALMINALLMILVVILMASGFNPIILAVVFGLIILSGTIFLSTSRVAVAGPAFVSALLIMTLLVGLIILIMTVGQTAGFGPESSDTLEGFSIYIGINFQHILIAATLLGTLGAIAEASISMAVGMNEIEDQASHAGIKQMGQEIIGTALNTLFFGFFGGFSSLFIWFASLHYPFSQIINNKIFVGELLQVLISVIAVVLTVPLTTWVVTTRQANHRKE
ncbi:YibE/F family protein [Lacticaseibacillus paracasei]|uniref:YibE/F family protein n=1 Tax=Lacticaseibacillus paracasei TaxID=1597 RepID=UPI003398D791